MFVGVMIPRGAGKGTVGLWMGAMLLLVALIALDNYAVGEWSATKPAEIPVGSGLSITAVPSKDGFVAPGWAENPLTSGHLPPPVEFLHDLEAMRDSNGKWTEYTFPSPGVRGWITKKDLPVLLAMVDSKAPCAAVALDISNVYYADSTVGAEALFLIEGCREGIYPPATYSGGVNRDKAVRWAREQLQ